MSKITNQLEVLIRESPNKEDALLEAMLVIHRELDALLQAPVEINKNHE